MIFKKEIFLKQLTTIKLYIFYFLIFFLPISKATTEIFFTLIFLLWLLERIISKRKLKDYLPKTELNIPIFLLLAVLFATIFNSVAPRQSLRGFFGKWFEFVMLYFFTVDIVDSEKKFKTIFWLFTSSLTLIIVDAVYQSISGRDFLYLRSLEQGIWIRGYFTSLNIFGGLLVLLAPIVLFFLSTFEQKIIRIYTFLLFSLSSFCLLFSNSAESWIFVSLSLIFGLFFYGDKRSFKRVILFLFLFWAVIFSFSPFSRNRILPLWRVQVISQEGRLVGRTAIWKAILQEAKNNPILGKGINTTRASIIRKYGSNRVFVKLLSENHPHSLYLFMLLETGILGLLVFLWFLYNLFKILIHLKKDLLSYGLFTGIVGFLGVNLVDLMWGERMQGLFWIVIALVVVYVKLEYRRKISY